MKKILFILAVFLLIVPFGVFSQQKIEFKTKILSMGVKESRVVIHAVYQTSLSKVIVEKGKTITFPPTTIIVDSICDTIKVPNKYVHNDNLIIVAYRKFGIPLYVATNEINHYRTNWGFKKREVSLADTTSFVYSSGMKTLNVSNWKNVSIKSRLDYALIIAWIVVILSLLIDLLFLKKMKDFKDIANKKLEIIFIIAVFIFVISIAIIFFKFNESSAVLFALLTWYFLLRYKFKEKKQSVKDRIDPQVLNGPMKTVK